MRHALTHGLAALGVVAGTAAPAFADLAEIKARGVLRVIYVPTNTAFPGESPFFAVKSATASGFDAEVLDRFCKRFSLRMEAVAVTTHQAAFSALNTGKGDVLAGNITVTDSRRKLAEFTVEVLPTRYVVVSRKPNRVIQTVDELRAEKVGTTRGTSRHEATVEAGVPAANIDDTLPMDGVGEALRKGKITAAVLEAYAAASYQRADPDIQLGMSLGPPQQLAYAVRLRGSRPAQGAQRARHVRPGVADLGAAHQPALRRGRSGDAEEDPLTSAVPTCRAQQARGRCSIPRDRPQPVSLAMKVGTALD